MRHTWAIIIATLTISACADEDLKPTSCEAYHSLINDSCVKWIDQLEGNYGAPIEAGAPIFQSGMSEQYVLNDIAYFYSLNDSVIEMSYGTKKRVAQMQPDSTLLFTDTGMWREARFVLADSGTYVVNTLVYQGDTVTFSQRRE